MSDIARNRMSRDAATLDTDLIFAESRCPRRAQRFGTRTSLTVQDSLGGMYNYFQGRSGRLLTPQLDEVVERS